MNNTENINMKVSSVKTISRKHLLSLLIKDHQQHFKMSNADVDRLLKLLPFIDDYGVLSLRQRSGRKQIQESLGWSKEEFRIFLYRSKLSGVITKPEGWVNEYKLNDSFIIPDADHKYPGKAYHRKFTEDFNACDYKAIELVIEHEITYNIID